MSKNLVVCLDGTGNQIERDISNVLKLYRTLKKSDDQIVFYDQGVGTLGLTHNWGQFKQKLVNLVLGLGFGVGLDGKVLEAYEFLIRHYEDGDRIYIFGYSRGAHAARVLAGLLYKVGLLRPELIHLSACALEAYKDENQQSGDYGAEASGDNNADNADEYKDDLYEGESENFRRVAKPRTVAIKFLGVWDTVSSVLIPNYKNFFIPPVKQEYLPHTSNNPAVQVFRQAAAIDEKRRMFRLEAWDSGQEYKPNKYSQGKRREQNAQQKWFIGSHGDVGGGYSLNDSGLSQYSLIWMIEEAEKQELKFTSSTMTAYVTGKKAYSSNTKYIYLAAEVDATLHNSVTPRWRILEYIPKRANRREWPGRKSVFGFYWPRSEPRVIAEDADIHSSVFDRRDMGVDGYDPENLKGHKRKPD